MRRRSLIRSLRSFWLWLYGFIFLAATLKSESTISTSVVLLTSEGGCSLFGGVCTGSSGQCITGAICDRRSRYTIKEHSGQCDVWKGQTGREKQLFERSVSSLQIREIENYMAFFSSLYHFTKLKKKNISIKIQIYYTCFPINSSSSTN